MWFAVSFGFLTLVLNRRYLHVCIEGPRPVPAEPPVLHGGMFAEHLTVPFEPLRSGPHRGQLGVHLKYPDGHREYLCYLDAANFSVVMNAIGADIRRHAAERARYVTSTDLSEAGYLLVLPSDEFVQSVDRALDEKRVRLRVNDAVLAKLGRMMGYYRPQLLDQVAPSDLPSPIPAMRAGESDRDTDLWLAFDPDVGRWRATPPPSNDALFDIFSLHAGPALWDTMITIARELGSRDLSKLRAARERASRVPA